MDRRRDLRGECWSNQSAGQAASCSLTVWAHCGLWKGGELFTDCPGWQTGQVRGRGRLSPMAVRRGGCPGRPGIARYLVDEDKLQLLEGGVCEKSDPGRPCEEAVGGDEGPRDGPPGPRRGSRSRRGCPACAITRGCSGGGADRNHSTRCGRSAVRFEMLTGSDGQIKAVERWRGIH